MDKIPAALMAAVVLAMTAGLASYWISQWSPIRDRRGLMWSAIGLGTALLTIATAVAVLAVRALPHFHVADINLGPPESTEFSADPPPTSTAAKTPSTAPAQPDEATVFQFRYVPRGPSIDPWSATRCVRALHPDVTDRTRWTLENYCDSAVAIVIAGCTAELEVCDDMQTPTWTYRPGGIVLPPKYQRSVSDDEQRMDGTVLRYRACYVTDIHAIRLLSLHPDDMIKPSWQEQFDAVRDRDECISQVSEWSRADASAYVPLHGLNDERGQVASPRTEWWYGTP